MVRKFARLICPPWSDVSFNSIFLNLIFNLIYFNLIKKRIKELVEIVGVSREGIKTNKLK